jgi:transcriptional regulator GlxA family with amidase domain
MTPAKYVEKVRIDAARHHLGDDHLRIETVAVKAGFGDPERMRRAFMRYLGVSPQDYRERFGRTEPPPINVDRQNVAMMASLNKF